MIIALPVWGIEATGYTPKTTFWQDFSIADRFGPAAVKDTYERAFAEWKNDIVYITELVLVINWKIWQHHHAKRDDLAFLYNKLWEHCDGWCMDNLEGEDLKYFLETTD